MIRDAEVFGSFFGFIIGLFLVVIASLLDFGWFVGFVLIFLGLGIFSFVEEWRDFLLPCTLTFSVSFASWLVLFVLSVSEFWWYLFMLVCIVVSLFLVVIAWADLNLSKS